jgi:hypothetical protein
LAEDLSFVCGTQRRGDAVGLDPHQIGDAVAALVAGGAFGARDGASGEIDGIGLERYRSLA